MIKVVILSINIFSLKEGMILIKIDVKDEIGLVKLVFFNKSYIKNIFCLGDLILVFGKVKKKFNNLEFILCELEYFINLFKNICRFMFVY